MEPRPASLGDIGDRANIVGDVLADLAVAPSGALDEDTVLVAQGQLELGHGVAGLGALAQGIRAGGALAAGGQQQGGPEEGRAEEGGVDTHGLLRTV